MGYNRNLKILIDTNILLYIYNGLDPFFGIITSFNYKPEFYIHINVLKELELLNEKYKNGFVIPAKVRMAKKYLDTYKNMWILIRDYEELPADEALIMTAIKYNMFIFTNDKELKNKAIKKGIGVIFLQKRGKIIKSLYPI